VKRPESEPDNVSCGGGALPRRDGAKPITTQPMGVPAPSPGREAYKSRSFCSAPIFFPISPAPPLFDVSSLTPSGPSGILFNLGIVCISFCAALCFLGDTETRPTPGFSLQTVGFRP
jgi:hypothetical protein